MDINSWMVIILALLAMLVGVGLGFLVGVDKNKHRGSSALEKLEVENIELKSELAKLKSPANDIEALKAKMHAHIIDNENNLKKILNYEKKIRKLEDRTLSMVAKPTEKLQDLVQELQRKLETAEHKVQELLSRTVEEQPMSVFTSLPKIELQEETEKQLRNTYKPSAINFDRIGIANNQKDNLRLINGIGENVERKLNEVGIFTFSQIANFDDDDIRIVNEAIEFFPGRILKDNWVGQAKRLLNT